MESMTQEYTLINDLTGLIDEIKPNSIVSRTFFKSDQMKAIMFGFDTGQELSEHTASQMATIQILQGEATVTLGGDTHELSAGSWIQMPPRLKHSVHAKTPVIMLLSMFELREKK
jgi:quercetin dioxygenase-like cupin family protein